MKNQHSRKHNILKGFAHYEYADAVSEELDQLGMDLHLELYQYIIGSGSGKRCAEAAMNLVEGYADFFYGVHGFTKEQLDSLNRLCRLT